MVKKQTEQLGFLLATSAFIGWGLFPIYWKAIDFCEPTETLFWRCVFTVMFLLPWGLRQISHSQLLYCIPLGILIVLNWGAFIFAIDLGLLMQSSLAYFIAPLLSVFLGAMFLKEDLSPATKAAILLASIATVVKVLASPEPVYIAIVMSFSFAAYGLLKKLQRLDPLQSLFFESLVGTLLVSFFLSSPPDLLSYSLREIGLLSLSGPVTIFTLILFAHAAKYIRLQSIGFLNYLVPIAHLLLAVMLYGEPFTQLDMTTFGLIWLAIAIFLLSRYAPKRLTKPQSMGAFYAENRRSK